MAASTNPLAAALPSTVAAAAAPEAASPQSDPFTPPPPPTVGAPVADWDDAFRKLLNGCFSNQEHQRGEILNGTIFGLVFAGTSIAVGAVILAQKDLDATTVAIGAIGVVAAAGEVGGLISSLRTVSLGAREDRSRQEVLAAAWESSDAATRLNLVQTVGQTCDVEEDVARDLQMLGPPPGAPAPPR